MNPDEVHDRAVTLTFPRDDGRKSGSHPSSDSDTWLRMLEMALEVDFKDYILDVAHDLYNQHLTVTVVFASIDDAMLFKLQHGR